MVKEKEQEETIEDLGLIQEPTLLYGQFSIASRIYSKEFKKVTFIIFNSETGELKKEVMKNDI